MNARISIARAALAALTLQFGVLPACSFNDHSQPRCSDKGKCASGLTCLNGFCINLKHGSGGKGGTIEDAALDAGKQDAQSAQDGALKDAAPDGGSDAGDSGTRKACKEGDQQQCFDGDLKVLTYEKTACRGGVQDCEEQGDAGWFFSACSGETLPAAAEICNGLDDDCNGKVDEDIPAASCTADNASGACSAGMTSCGDDHIPRCEAIVTPSVETCDGIDNDCDGHVDEGTDVPCYPDATTGCTKESDGTYTCAGACKPGTQKCVDGKLQTTCDAQLPAADDGCTNSGSAADDDCDDKIDEDCACTTGHMQDCYTGPNNTEGVGICSHGTQTCNGSNHYDACSGDTTPKPETCMNQGADDDCNGMPDDVAMLGDPCIAATNQGICKTGVYKCVGTDLACVTPAMTDEICNGLDDDCDGKVDNGFDLLNDEKNCGACNHKCAASETCCGGVCADAQTDADHCGASCTACGSGRTCCSGTCANLANDNNHCGVCTKRCAALTSGLTCTCTNRACGGVCL